MESGSDDSRLQGRREELFQLVWSRPSEQVAEIMGISGVALSKRCLKLGVPKPPRGYWARYRNKPDRPIPPLAAYKEAVAAKLKGKVIQPGLHLPERKLELFQKAAEMVLTQNTALGCYELKGSRLLYIDPALASAALTSAINHFQEFLPNTPFVSARQVAAGLIDALLPLAASNVLVFQKSERAHYRAEKEFIVVRVSENLLRHIANAHRLIGELQLAFSAIPLKSSEYFQNVRYILDPRSRWITRADLCVSATDAWLRIKQESPEDLYETASVPIEHLAPLSFVPEQLRYTYTDPEVRIYREDWELLKILLEAEDMYEMGSSVVYDLQDADLHKKLARAMKLWWPKEQFQALQALQKGLLVAEQEIEQWESELATAKLRLCQKILGIRLGDILQVMQQGKPGRIRVDRLDVFKHEHEITFMAHGKLFRKNGVEGKRRETLYLSLPTTIAHQLTGYKEPPQPSPQHSPMGYPFWKWSWRR